MWNSAGYFYRSDWMQVDIFLHVDMPKNPWEIVEINWIYLFNWYIRMFWSDLELITPLDPLLISGVAILVARRMMGLWNYSTPLHAVWLVLSGTYPVCGVWWPYHFIWALKMLEGSTTPRQLCFGLMNTKNKAVFGSAWLTWFWNRK